MENYKETLDAYQGIILLLSVLAIRNDAPKLNNELEELRKIISNNPSVKIMHSHGNKLKRFLPDLLTRKNNVISSPKTSKTKENQTDLKNYVKQMVSIFFDTMLVPNNKEELLEIELLKSEWEKNENLSSLIPPLDKLVKNNLIHLQKERQLLVDLISDIWQALNKTQGSFLSRLEADYNQVTEIESTFQNSISDNIGKIETILSCEKEIIKNNSQIDISSLLNQVKNKINNLKDELSRKQDANEKHLSNLTSEKIQAEQALTKLTKHYNEHSNQLVNEMADLKIASLMDPLTKTYNRRAYEHQLEKIIEDLTLGMLKTFSLVIYDIDHFRGFNNTHGHLMGDKILINVSKITLDCLRKSDRLFRYGGDEFVIILPEANGKDATNIAEKIRSSLENTDFKLFKNEETIAKLTLSFGISEANKEDSAMAIFTRADDALYQAKEKGRNQVVLYENAINLF